MTKLHPEVEAQLIREIDGPAMMHHVSEIAKWTRHTGTPEELESFSYLKETMERYGYKTQLFLHDAYVSLPGVARVEALGRNMRCITHSFSRSAPAGGLEAELVYVGKGTPGDFFGRDVTGKIVLVDGIASPGASQAASRNGAAGQLHISPHEHLHEMCISPVWGSPSQVTVVNLPKTVICSISLADGEAIREAIKAGPVRVRLHAEVDTRWRKTPLLICDLPGDDPDKFVMYSGHYDSWYYGAMDNGGANATMLEVARLCATRRDHWRRGLRVAFWSGHSQGRYSGSTWYSDQFWEELEAGCVAHVNVDSTGGMGNTVVADTTASAQLGALAREALQSQAGQAWSGRRNGRAGDQSFWGIGVPPIFGNMSEQPARPDGTPNAMAAVFGGGNRVGHGTGWWWHNPADTYDKMDEAVLVRDTKIYQQVVWRLLTEPILPVNYADFADYAGRSFRELQAAAGEHFDLSILIQRADALKARMETLNQLAAQVNHEPQLRAINQCLQDLGHILVPVDYSEGDRFGQDPALGQSAFPSLDPVRRFGTLDPGSDEARHLTVGMMRSRNRVGHGLRQAIRRIDACVGEIKG